MYPHVRIIQAPDLTSLILPTPRMSFYNVTEKRDTRRKASFSYTSNNKSL